MNTEDIKKEIRELEERVNELQSHVTSEMFEKAKEEEKIEYLKLITDIKVKLEVLKSL